MECYYHPDRESTDKCAICGKSVCKECGLEIAGKIYCKECLEKIIGAEITNDVEQEPEPIIVENPVETEPVVLNAQDADESVYQIQEETVDFEIPYAPETESGHEFKGIDADSPYNIKDSIEYSGGLESSYLDESESIYQAPPSETPQVAQNELDTLEKEILAQKNEDDFIYPDHSYEPQPTSARLELEDKYEKYLDDLYFDENDIPLGEQLAKDEEKYGSLTRKEYAPRPKEVEEQEVLPPKKALKDETPEEMEARIRAEILKEQNLMTDKEDKSIHNLSYKDEKESMGIVDILLTIILIIVILIVLYYLVYLFLLSSTYPTFMDALFALRNPQNVINAILTH